MLAVAGVAQAIFAQQAPSAPPPAPPPAASGADAGQAAPATRPAAPPAVAPPLGTTDATAPPPAAAPPAEPAPADASAQPEAEPKLTPGGAGEPPPVPQAVARLEGLLITDLQVIGIEDAQDRQLAENQLHSRPGTPLSAETVAGDLHRLARLGRFKTIEVSAEVLHAEEADTVRLLYLFQPTPIIKDVEVTGNDQVSTSDISDEVSLLVGTAVDPFELDRARRRVERLYRDKGYHRASVTIDQEYLDETGIVLFRISEGPRVRVTDIRFEGNHSFPANVLRGEIHSKTWIPIIEKAPLDGDVLDQDVASIARFYRDRGYLDVRVDTLPVRFSPDGREAIVTFVIEEGQIYTLRNVKAVRVAEGGEVTDDPPRVFTPVQLAGLMEIKSGDVYSVRAVDDSLQAVRDAYARMGYVIGTGVDETFVSRAELRDVDEPFVDLQLQVYEGKRYRTGLITITGDDITQQRVIRREVALKPGEWLDGTAIDLTRRRLEALNLFKPGSVRVTVQPPPADGSPYRDVNIEIEETNTGSLSFGASANTDLGFVGFINLTQRNFDIFDLPDSAGELFTGHAFRGGGQTLSIQVQPGNETHTYAISLAEPHLFDTNYSGSIGGSYRSRIFEQYDENRVSGSLALGHRLGQRWSIASNFRFEQIGIEDIETDAPVDVFDVEGNSQLGAIGFSLSRTTTDVGYRPSKGVKTSLGVEQVGLGGDYDFTKLSFEHAIFFPVYEDFLGRDTIFSVRTDINYIPQDEDSVPTFERYYLGGRNMRGFRYRTVSPKGIQNDTMTLGDDPVGGTWSFFAGAEIEQPIVGDTIAVVGFLDSGTVTNEPGFDDYRLSGGVGLRLYLPIFGPAPLAFDFGFPILKETGDEERVFSFSVDVPFQ